MNPLKRLRRPAPAAQLPDSDQRVAGRLDALELDYPNRKTHHSVRGAAGGAGHSLHQEATS